MQHFFYKLIPPRPDFHLNQTEREKVIMQQHAAYWDGLTAEKKAIVYGPVFHEDGVFGICRPYIWFCNENTDETNSGFY